MPVIRQDPYTIPEQSWFEHFKKFFDWGIVGLAEDGSDVVITKIDHFYGNGYSCTIIKNPENSFKYLYKRVN